MKLRGKNLDFGWFVVSNSMRVNESPLLCYFRNEFS